MSQTYSTFENFELTNFQNFIRSILLPWRHPIISAATVGASDQLCCSRRSIRSILLPWEHHKKCKIRISSRGSIAFNLAAPVGAFCEFCCSSESIRSFQLLPWEHPIISAAPVGASYHLSCYRGSIAFNLAAPVGASRFEI